MRDFIELGSTPPAEPCAQVGNPDYQTKAKAECERYRDYLRAVMGIEPSGADLVIKANRHDFGVYYEVSCYFESDNKEAREYAFRLDSEGPETWDEVLP